MSKIKHVLSAPGRYVKDTVQRLGPRAFAIVLCAFMWCQIGIGTLQGYSGKPADAPHLLVDGNIRGAAWILTAVLALILALRKNSDAHRTAIVLLTIMPTVRLVSYFISWVLSLDIVGDVFAETQGLQGSPSALYGTAIWQSMLVLLMFVMFLPLEWRTVTQYLSEEEEEEKISRAVDFSKPDDKE